MIKSHDPAQNSPAGILSIHTRFTNRSSTYLSQAAPQNRLRNNYRPFTCVIIKTKTKQNRKTPTLFGRIPQQRNTAKTGFYLSKTKRAPECDQQGNAESRSKAAASPQHRDSQTPCSTSLALPWSTMRTPQLSQDTPALLTGGLF